MEGLGKDHAYSDPSLSPSTAREEHAVAGVTTRRLRDREMLRKRKAEAQEKDSIQWATGEQERSKQPRKRRGARRGRGRQPMVKRTLKPEPEPDPEPLAQKEAELVPPMPERQAQPPMMAMQEMLGGVQMGALEGEMASGSQGPLGELPESCHPCGDVRAHGLGLWGQVPLPKSWGGTKSPLLSAEWLAQGLWLLVLNSSCAKDISVGIFAWGRSVSVLTHLPGTTGQAKRLCNSKTVGSQRSVCPQSSAA
ncbi:hemogen [Oxyura jamaicensis]|uniref:hemogen n=1 Tax=Oxyura jamaicensis TaxID=8884 RepID=UPI0015A568D2|nr:hemogen [Oxyura jamaicensis]